MQIQCKWKFLKCISFPKIPHHLDLCLHFVLNKVIGIKLFQIYSQLLELQQSFNANIL